MPGPIDHARNSLTFTEERLRLILDAAPIGMLMVNSTGNVVYLNSQIERMFQYENSELLGRSIEQLVPEAVRAKHPAYRDVFLTLPQARTMGAGRDLFGLRKDGSQIPVEIGLTPLQAEDELFVLATVVDITERKRSEERLRLMIEAAPSGMIMVDHQGKIVLVNSQIENLFGYSRVELINQSIEMLVPDAARQRHAEYRQSYIKEPTTRAMGAGRDLYGRHKSSALVPVEIGLNPLISQGESFVLASVVDITERKRAEILLNDKVLELERSNSDLQQFAYVCSHDLQEPLRVIASYTQLLAQRYNNALDQDANDFIEFIVDGSQRMQGLINDLLLYSRVQTRGQEFAKVDVALLVDTVASNLQLAIQESGAEIIKGTLPVLRGDNSQLVQLFQNLVSNAIKFRACQTPQIVINAIDAGSFWQFEVKDNGIGLDMKHAERIFVIFQRLHTKEMYPGSGIGLAICKKIVERHGGQIWVESAPGKGSTFRFTLPKSGRQEPGEK